ncbi:MAG: putative Na+/H+ antiporter [Verrucomicrobiota bacterium JB022]|nr:putative Na+/H+ antiporter [Verrucomicrobiota bacterium JB022]
MKIGRLLRNVTVIASFGWLLTLAPTLAAAPQESGHGAAQEAADHAHDEGHGDAGHGGGHHEISSPVPYDLNKYQAQEEAQGITTLGGKLAHRIQEDPFNLVATIIFLLAVAHTFAAGFFMKLAHKYEHEHEEKIQREGLTAEAKPYRNAKDDTSFRATVFHFLGEVEAVFGIWCIPLVFAIFGMHGFDWHAVTGYFDVLAFQNMKYTEPLFVIVIMAIASTRPILKFSEKVLGLFAGLGGRKPSAWWMSILIVGPLLGSFITEPAAMTIAALLLAAQFYRYEVSTKFKYATLGLLFVNVSVGGTLTHFAAPPVLMVAGTWGWDLIHMFDYFGYKAVTAIVIATALYYFIFKKEFVKINAQALAEKDANQLPEEPVPFWITGVILLFMAWTVFTLHHPPMFVAGFLFFLAFVAATRTHQDDVSIKGPLLVGFFLAALVTHGSLQNWWISPVLGKLNETALFLGSTLLTAFNDNAAITFLASQVPEFGTNPALQYAVVAGAVTGGGLTVIANAPNPAGQSLLQKFFPGGVSPLNLALAALAPTAIVAVCFLFLPHIGGGH